MKTTPQFTIGDAVQTTVNSGRVQQIAEFADHFEYLVQWPDQTAAWIHEEKLSAVGQASPRAGSSGASPHRQPAAAKKSTPQ